MTSGSSGRFYFNTEAMAARDRFPAFCEELMRRYARLDVRVEDRTRFAAELSQRQLATINVGRDVTTALGVVRTPELLRDGDDKLYLTLLETGAAHQSQRGNDRAVAPGEAIICDGGYVGECNFIADARHWHIHVPRQKLTALVPAGVRFAGAKLEADVAARRLLFSYLKTTTDHDPSGSRDLAQLCEDHIVDLIALAMGATGDSHRQAQERGVRAARLSAVLSEIGRRSGSQNLNVASVAARLGVTPRYVHLLLEQTGRSFTDHVLERRLQRAAALLSDPQRHDGRIGDIALEAGFTDLSYFNRSFRRRYGVTPSEMRQESGALPPVGDALQSR